MYYIYIYICIYPGCDGQHIKRTRPHSTSSVRQVMPSNTFQESTSYDYLSPSPKGGFEKGNLEQMTHLSDLGATCWVVAWSDPPFWIPHLGGR